MKRLTTATSTVSSARAWKSFIGLGVVFAIVYELLPTHPAKLIVWPLIGWSSVAAILIGVKRNRPGDRAAWYLVAAGVATFIAGDNLYSFRSYVQHAQALFPSYVDAVYLAVYPLLIAGLVRMVRRRSGGRDRASMLDAGIITGGLGLVAWVFLIAPYVRSDELSLVERLVSMAYPLGDVALLAIAVRLAVGSGRRPLSFWLLVGSLVPLLAADSAYGYLNLSGNWYEHNPIDLLWIGFYIGWGATALHPSMTQLTKPAARSRRNSARRLLVVGAAVLVPPAVLFVQQASGTVVDGAAISIVSAVMFVLVMVRVAGLAGEDADQRSEARFRTLIDNASDAIVVLDSAGIVRYHTPSTARVLGCELEMLDGRPLADMLERGDVERLYLLLTGKNATTTVQWRLRESEAVWRDLEVIASDMRGLEGVDGVVLTMRNVTERTQLDAELRRQALHDGLTNLPNRTLFLDRVEQALGRARRSGDSVAVLFLDLDDFKTVNDSFGHASGDEVLIAVAARMDALAGEGDTVARFGGDEFALLIETCSGLTELRDLADLVGRSLNQPIRIGTEEVRVQASIGLAVGAAATHRPDDLLREADLAMYVAKSNGKRRSAIFEPAMHDEARRRLETAKDLVEALERDELVIYYQPIVDVHTGRIRGAEALSRWQHPRRGLVQPLEFIPIAETTGLIIQIGQCVLNQACTQTQQWKRERVVDAEFYISVNLSARHVQDPRVVDHVISALRHSQLAPAALMLEVTETALIKDLTATSSTLVKLKELGVRIAVDDFGTGYSSLSYLSMFPIDVIKIDKSFIDKLALSSEGEAMVRAVVEMARTLGLVAVAEGVEEQAQATALERLGCPLAQGFLFAQPVSAIDLERSLAPAAAGVVTS